MAAASLHRDEREAKSSFIRRSSAAQSSLALAVLRCTRRAPPEEEAQQDIHLAHRLEEARVIERAGIDRLEVYGLRKVPHLCLGRLVVAGDEYLDVAALA